MDAYIKYFTDYIASFGLSPKDLLANGLFFGLDVILITIMVPLILNWMQERKWKRARKEIARRSYEFVIAVSNRSSVFCRDMSFTVWRYDKKMSGELDGVNEDDVLQFFNRANNSRRRDVDVLKSQYSQSIQFLSPAFNYESAIILSDLYNEVSRYIDDNCDCVSYSVRNYAVFPMEFDKSLYVNDSIVDHMIRLGSISGFRFDVRILKDILSKLDDDFNSLLM